MKKVKVVISMMMMILLGVKAYAVERSGNTLTIIGEIIKDNIFGGVVGDGAATSNVVRISTASVKNVWGGRVGTGTATLNVVRISSATVGENVYGGVVLVSGEVRNNVVEISSASVINGNVCGGAVNGGVSSTVVSGNRVSIEGSKVEGSVYGGHINGNSPGNIGKVEYNEVEIINGYIVGDVYGRRIESNGGDIERIIRGNRVMIEGG